MRLPSRSTSRGDLRSAGVSGQGATRRIAGNRRRMPTRPPPCANAARIRLQSRARHASSDRDRHAARAAGPRGRCSCDVRGAHGRRPTSAHHDFVVASTHPGRARSARVTGHVCRQLVSGDHLHHGLLAASSLGHCGTPVPITGDGAIPTPSFHIGRGTRGRTWTDSPRAGTVARLVTCLSSNRSMLSGTPGGRGRARRYCALRVACACMERIGTHQHERVSGLRVRFRASPFTSRLSRSSFQRLLIVISLLSG